MTGAGIRRNKFTDEQVEILRNNPYVRSATEDTVSFTVEFKEEFWHLYTEEDMMPYDILCQMDIDYYILGSSRVQGIVNNMKKERKRYGCFRRIYRADTPGKLPLNQEIARLKMEVEYLRQEKEFLKKIITAEKDGKSK
ncbi:MAG: transposase [Oscillospiraceae bacterium]|nr:transposase [Oscillospiraceae bacterium]